MSIVAKFEADFTQFVAAVTGAEASLKKLESSSQQIGSGVNSLIGTMSTLASAVGIGFGVGAVVNFGKSLLDDAEHMVKLSDTTGMSIGALKEFERVAIDSGSSVDGLAAAAYTLQQNIGKGDAGTVGNLRALHLSLDDVKNLSMDDMFFTVARALHDVNDQVKFVTLGGDLMGKAFKDAAPAIKQGFSEIDKEAEKTARTLNDASNALKQFYQGFKTEASNRLAIELRGAGDALTTLKQLFLDGTFLTADWDAATAKAAATAAEHAKAITEQGAAHMATAINATEQANKERVLTEEIKDNTAEVKAAADAAKKWALITDELNTAGTTWRQTLDTIDGEVVEAVKYYLAAGVAQNTLADAYALTAVQVKAAAEALTASKKEEEAVTTRLNAAVVAEIEAGNRLNAVQTAAISPLDQYTSTVDRLNRSNEFRIPLTNQLAEAEKTLMDALYQAAVAQDKEYDAIIKANQAKEEAIQKDTAVAAAKKQTTITGQGIPAVGNVIGPGGRLFAADYGGNIGIPQGGWGTMGDNIGMPSQRGSISITNSLSGMLLTTDPQARQQLMDAINAAVTQSLRTSGAMR